MASLIELLDVLDSDEYRRGKQFERIVEWFLTHAPEYKSRLRRVWLWDDWPDRPSKDLGIDLVAEERSGGVWAIQAKAYQADSSVTLHDMAAFLAASASRRFSYRLLVATTDRIGANARKIMEQQAIPVGMKLRSDLIESGLNWPASIRRLVANEAPKKTLRTDQRQAVRDVLAGFKLSMRGQMIRACGTGKTLTSLGVHESLQANRTLVLVPSLSLLSQTLREWTANTKEPFQYLAVCSDEQVADPDAPVSFTNDLGVPVTTDANKIASFLRRRGHRVIFSTYQSSPQVAAAYRKRPKPPSLDLAICDEAHRCAGRVSNDFATILDATKIQAKYRLFMTATPRYFTGRIVREAERGDLELASMDDESVFGPVFHRLTFGEAIRRDLLSDYQVAIVNVDDATYKEWAKHGKFVTREGKETNAREVAGQLGLAKAMRRFDLHRVITFHNRIEGARHFSIDFPALVAWMPTSQRPTGRIRADYISGRMPTGERRPRLLRLANPGSHERVLLSNARCLAEGVDVPTLDGVAFLDPKRSEIDIVQAVGRAIRKAPDKSVGTIVLPVFIESGEDAVSVLEGSSFEPVWRVMQALRAHDEDLAETLDAFRTEMGIASNSFKLPPIPKVILPTRLPADFARAFEVRLVEQTTVSWEFWYGLLQRYSYQSGSANPPVDCIMDGRYKLGLWANTQRSRYREGRLSQNRQERLSAWGFAWEPRDEAWERGLDSLRLFVHRNSHARVPSKYVDDDGFRLGQWVVNQRVFDRKHMLDRDRKEKLNECGFVWHVPRSAWETHFRLLEEYVRNTGSASVPQVKTWRGFALGRWVAKQRRALPRLSPERVARLEHLAGWTWDTDASTWQEFFTLLVKFVKDEGHSRIPSDCIIEDKKLGKWVENQRSRREGLTDEQVKLLESVGFVWNTKEAQWEDCFEALRAYAEHHNNFQIPKEFLVAGVRLASWVKTQRHNYNQHKLSDERISKLESIEDWTWNPRQQQWDDYFTTLEVFAKHQGDALVPNDYVDDGVSLGKWIERQRSLYRQHKLSPDHRRRLEKLPGFAWDPHEARWSQAYQLLQQWMKAKSHPTPRVPVGVIYRGFPLGDWVATQRAVHHRGKMLPDRIQRLNQLRGWRW